MLRPRDDFYSARHPLPRDVLLVDAAHSSLHFDRDTKMRLYAQHGIPEAWLVDLRGRRFVRYHAPQKGEYAVVDEPELADPLRAAALRDFAVDPHGLFGV